MRDIQKSDIIGARVVDIHQTYELNDGGLECIQVYFTVDRGFTFITPTAGLPWTSVKLPNNARRLDETGLGWLGRLRFIRPRSLKIKIVENIKKRRISGMYCGPFDKELDFHYPFDGTIVFEDGSQASNNVVAPYGTGGAGLYFFQADSGKCTPLEELADYFTIPRKKSET